MTVRVKVSPHLLEYFRGPHKTSGDSELEVAEGTTVAELLDTLDLPDELETVTVVNDVYYSEKPGLMPLVAEG